MNISRLVDLPVELFHDLFNYFSAHEILYTFTNVTSYINSILTTYSDYRVNFQAISRNHFDLVCQNIVPDQVIALTLSDDKDTPGLIGLFLSQFRIDQFTRLQALKLIDIGPDFWEDIVTHMVTLKHLQSFQYYASNKDSTWICNLASPEVTKLDYSLFCMYAPILPQLVKLRLSHGNFLYSIQFPYLRYLVLERSNIDLIKQILSVAPELQILDTTLSCQKSSTELIPLMPRLNRLILRIQNVTVSMNGLEQMMSNLPRLRHLALVCHCDTDVVDGKNWERIAKNLYTFKFNFTFDDKIELEQLDSFRTSFWLNDKRWFVAYILGRFYSLSTSEVIRIETKYDFELFQYTTLPNSSIFLQYVRELVLSKGLNYLNHRIPYVKTLTLCNPPSLLTITKIVDLGQVRNMTLLRLRKNFPIKSLINKMSNLCELSIKCDIENFFKKLRHQVFYKIRTLRIYESDIFSHDFVDSSENLSTIFPRVKHLHIDYRCSIEEISNFLHDFEYLSLASFSYTEWYNYQSRDEFREYIQSGIKRMRHEEGLNLTYRIDSSRIHLWIGSQSNNRSI